MNPLISFVFPRLKDTTHSYFKLTNQIRNSNQNEEIERKNKRRESLCYAWRSFCRFASNTSLFAWSLFFYLLLQWSFLSVRESMLCILLLNKARYTPLLKPKQSSNWKTAWKTNSRAGKRRIMCAGGTHGRASR